MITPRQGTPADVNALALLWRRSVEATHDFLSTADIDALEPEARAGIAAVDLWVVERDGAPIGFMGLRGDMIEMLFVDPAARGQGVGTRFVEHARRLLGGGAVLRVDVNEQNPQGVGFYRAKGFRQIGRSDHDSAGRPWPLLHLVLDKPRPDAMDFDELIRRAKAAVNPRRLSGEAEAGGVGAAILTDRGRVYVGVCIDTACSMGFCAEHAAAAAMVTAGESRVAKMVAVDWDGKILPPCGRCREFVRQLDDGNGEAEVLVAPNQARRLKELLPFDWREAAPKP